MANTLNFIHLSDIHFRYKYSGGVYDLDLDIRNELDRDTKNLVKKIGKVNALLITGDIAFAGKPEEYKVAGDWLNNLCANIDCPEENVWTVPGNHDVDRTKIQCNLLIKDAHERLREVPPEQINERLKQYFDNSKDASRMLFDPLENYIGFASHYKCELKPGQLIWKCNFELNDGSTLCLVGLNSTLISDEKDDDGANKLILGEAQLDLLQKDGVEYMTLCHHPPQWLRDQDSVQIKLNNRARIQLFGHKHSQTSEEIDRRSVRIVAGALHPDRNEGNWIPAYNYITLTVNNINSDRLLEVKVYERVWDPNTLCFVPGLNSEASDHKTYILKLDDWTPSSGKKESKQKDKKESTIKIDQQPEVTEDLDNMNRYRRLTYRFLQLPYNVQIQIAQKLELLRDEDKGLKDGELYERFFQRVQENNLLKEFWDIVEEAHEKSGIARKPLKEK